MAESTTVQVALSALQHYLYCPRQCALIHVERLWAEDRSTAEGRVLHERADSGKAEHRPGVRIERSLAVACEQHGLTGICDIVEIHRSGQIMPIEYKRGRPKAHRADEVQLCAQAICLEATFNRPEGSIQEGHLFYGKTQRRKAVSFDTRLRDLVLETTAKVRSMIETHRTPLANYAPKLCDRCSLINLCQPKAMRLKRGTQAWFECQWQATCHEPPDTDP